MYSKLYNFAYSFTSGSDEVYMRNYNCIPEAFVNEVTDQKLGTQMNRQELSVIIQTMTDGIDLTGRMYSQRIGRNACLAIYPYTQ